MDSRDEELGLYEAEDLEDVLTMFQLGVCVAQDVFCQDPFLAN